MAGEYTRCPCTTSVPRANGRGYVCTHFQRMDLSKIISVAGKGGLFRVVAQGRQAIIAESLEDGKRIPVPSSVRVSALDEISMFTKGDDVKLQDVLQKLYEVEKGKPSIDPKEDVDKLFKKLGEALPDHDRERIYPSDVRKFFTWYALLLKAGVFAAKEDEKKDDGDKAKDETKAKKTAAKGAKAKADIAGKKGGAAKPAAGGKASAVRRGGQRGS
jgi:hypothetical protein